MNLTPGPILRHHRARCAGFLLGLFLWGMGVTAWGNESLYYEEPQALKGSISDVHLSLIGERDDEERHYADGSRQKQESNELWPTVGATLNGSVYHSALLNYSMSGETGLGWENSTYQQTGADGITTTEKSQGTSPFDQYNVMAILLSEKPYSTTLSANRYTTRRSTDLFSRTTYEYQDWGVQSGYNDGPVPTSVTAGHSESTEKNTLHPQITSADTVGASASNRRAHGSTLASVNRTDSTQQNDSFISEGHSVLASLLDSESYLGGYMNLASSLNYDSFTQDVRNENATNEVDRLLQQSRQLEYTRLTWREGLTVNHTERLTSLYDFSMLRQETGSDVSTWDTVSASLMHRLYESLNSRLYTDYLKADESGNERDRYGGGIQESYMKRLGLWGHLSLGVGTGLHEETRQNVSGNNHTINESHTLKDNQVTFLNERNIDTSAVVVTDPGHTVIYSQGSDYELIDRGGVVEIRRVTGGRIPDGGTVLVSYPSVAKQAGSFSTTQNNANFRLDLWQSLLGLYGGYNEALTRDNGAGVMEEDLTSWLLGIDSSYAYLRVGAEHQDYQSNFTSYKSDRLFQELYYNLSEISSARLVCDQTWTTYGDSADSLRTQSYVARYHASLNRSLSFEASTGVRFRQRAIDASNTRDLFASSMITYYIGLTRINLYYDLQDQDALGTATRRQTITLNLRRSF